MTDPQRHHSIGGVHDVGDGVQNVGTRQAASNVTPVIAITDSQLSPLAKDVRILFMMPEDEYTFARSLAAPMCLAQ